ncbi:MAG: hypothetical protein FWD66_10510 [Paludibacter sp.]|nr:hypothetical protein [Paludibacter sp.]
MFKELLRYVLPSEIVDRFDLVDLQEQGETLHSLTHSLRMIFSKNSINIFCNFV